MRTVVLASVVAALAGSGCASSRELSPAGRSDAFPSATPSGVWSAPAPSASAAQPSASSGSLAPKSALDAAAAAAGSDPPSTPPLTQSGTEPEDPDRWRFEITPFLWIPEMSGTLGVGQLEGKIDLSMGDFVDTLTDNAENLLVFHAEAKTERFGFFGEVVYLDLEGEGEVTRTFGGQQIGPITIPTTTVPIDADVGFKSTTAELGATYTLTEAAAAGDLQGRARLEGIGGVRWMQVENTVDLMPGPDFGREEDWYDAFVGFRGSLPLGESVSVTFRGDLGGFGLGDSSDLSYRATAMIRWNLSRHVDLLAGRSLLDVDYETGSGRDAFEYDVRMSGPVAAITIRF